MTISLTTFLLVLILSFAGWWAIAYISYKNFLDRELMILIAMVVIGIIQVLLIVQPWWKKGYEVEVLILCIVSMVGLGMGMSKGLRHHGW